MSRFYDDDAGMEPDVVCCNPDCRELILGASHWSKNKTTLCTACHMKEISFYAPPPVLVIPRKIEDQ